MNFAKGDAVEVKVGTGLGRWVPGTVTKVTDWQGRATYDVRHGRGVDTVPGRQVRSPRRVGVTASPRAPRKTRKRVVDNTGRGPLRYPNYLKWVKTKPCIFCGRKADDPHHVGSKGLGQQTDDTKLVAVCRKAHDALHHRRPDELCEGMAYMRVDPEHAWAVVEAHLGRYQAEHITEFLRFHEGVMS